MHGESSSSRLRRSRSSTATPTSSVSASPVTSSAPSSRNGTPLLRPSSRPRPSMATWSVCSRSRSLAARTNRSRPPATPRLLRSRTSVPRWWRSWLTRPRNRPSRTSSESCKYSMLNIYYNLCTVFPNKSPSRSLRSAPSSTLSRTCSSTRRRSWRSPSSIWPSSWSFTRRTSPMCSSPPPPSRQTRLRLPLNERNYCRSSAVHDRQTTTTQTSIQYR